LRIAVWEADCAHTVEVLMRWTRGLAVAALLAAIGCGGSDDGGDPTGPPPDGGATNGTFTVSINGVTWSAQGTITVNPGPGAAFGFAGSGFAGANAYSIVIGIANVTSTAPHNLNVYAGGDGTGVILGGTTAGYGTAFQGGGGTLSVTSYTANRIIGTFSGTAVVSSGSAAPLTLTAGRFDITF
jgi:hypothetical protein